MTNKRKSAEQRGRFSETLAELFLMLKGYCILERRAKTHVGEIDLLAVKAKTVIAIEVKQRPSIEEGLNSVSDYSWTRIARATDSILAHKYPDLYDYNRRFDLVVIPRNFWLCHRIDTWRPDFPLT